MATQDKPGTHMAADAGGPQTHGREILHRALGIAAPILILSTCFLSGTAAHAQNGGYMRVLTSHG